MIKTTVHYFKLLFLFIVIRLVRLKKFVKFILFGKHEIERICEDNVDIYEKTMQFDRWLSQTNCRSIQRFMKKHLNKNEMNDTSLVLKTINKILNNYRKDSTEIKCKPNRSTSSAKKGVDSKSSISIEDSDLYLSTAVKDLSHDLSKKIFLAKGLKQMSASTRSTLKDIIYRIIAYKITLIAAEHIAATKYDSELQSHTDKLLSLWNNLVKADQSASKVKGSTETNAFPNDLSSEISNKSDIVSSRWSHIGFQGEDPGTDFRGMGILGLLQLEYLSQKPKNLARDLLKRSLIEETNYPFAIVGINITYNLLTLFRDGSMKHLYFDTGDRLFRSKDQSLKIFATFNELYVELFLRFDCFWRESKPKNIFEFKSLMDKFISIMRMDLCDRNFSLKFIY